MAATTSKLGMNDVDDLYNALGYNGITMTKVLMKLKPEYERIVKPEEQVVITDTDQVQTKTSRHIRHTGGVVVDGAYGCDVKFAKCCNPLPGDDIIGFVTKGYGISIHKRDCPNAVSGMADEKVKDRWLTAEWDLDDFIEENGRALYEVVLQIFAENDIMLIANITAAIADMKVTLLSINTKKRTENDIIINLTVGCKNIDHYNSILSRLRSIDHVHSIARGYS